MTKEQKQIIDNFLYKLWKPGYGRVCHNCGSLTGHALVWCRGCNSKYILAPKGCTNLEIMRIVHNRKLQNRKGDLRPDFAAAMLWRHLREVGGSKEEATEYMKELVEKEEKL